MSHTDKRGRDPGMRAWGREEETKQIHTSDGFRLSMRVTLCPALRKAKVEASPLRPKWRKRRSDQQGLIK